MLTGVRTALLIAFASILVCVPAFAEPQKEDIATPELSADDPVSPSPESDETQLASGSNDIEDEDLSEDVLEEAVSASPQTSYDTKVECLTQCLQRPALTEVESADYRKQYGKYREDTAKTQTEIDDLTTAIFVETSLRALGLGDLDSLSDQDLKNSSRQITLLQVDNMNRLYTLLETGPVHCQIVCDSDPSPLPPLLPSGAYPF